MTRVTRHLLAAISALALAVIWLSSLPLGVPGEWIWTRHAAPSGIFDLVDRALPVVVGGIPLFCVAMYGYRRIRNAAKIGIFLLFTGLMACQLLWLSQVQKTVPEPERSLKPWWVLYAPSSSGYFHEAVFIMASTDEFLNGYEERMAEGDVLHVGTHPPGLFLLSRFCLHCCDSSPALVSLLNTIESSDVSQSFEALEVEARIAPSLSNTQIAALHLLSLMTTLAVVGTTLPLAVLIWNTAGRTTAWQCCCLWTTLPCLAIFLPKSDLLFPLTATTALALYVLALTTRARFVAAVLCGLVLTGGLMLSLAHLPVIVLMGLLTVLRAAGSRMASLRADLPVLSVVAGTIVAVGLIFSATTDCNIASVWAWNIHNHQEFYSHYTRTWWKWMLVNPLELTLSIGPPLMYLAITGAVRAAAIWKTQPAASEQLRPLAEVVLAAAITFVLLWLSGKNQGEAARLWCFLTPWLVIATAVRPAVKDGGEAASPHADVASWRFLMATQLIYCAAVVARVSGFSLSA